MSERIRVPWAPYEITYSEEPRYSAEPQNEQPVESKRHGKLVDGGRCRTADLVGVNDALCR